VVLELVVNSSGSKEFEFHKNRLHVIDEVIRAMVLAKSLSKDGDSFKQAQNVVIQLIESLKGASKKK